MPPHAFLMEEEEKEEEGELKEEVEEEEVPATGTDNHHLPDLTFPPPPTTYIIFHNSQHQAHSPTVTFLPLIPLQGPFLLPFPPPPLPLYTQRLCPFKLLVLPKFPRQHSEREGRCHCQQKDSRTVDSTGFNDSRQSDSLDSSRGVTRKHV